MAITKKVLKQREAQERYPEYRYKNKHGAVVRLDLKTALNYGHKMIPLNDNAKNLVPRETNSHGEQIIREKLN
jgi:hypothetical protein